MTWLRDKSVFVSTLHRPVRRLLVVVMLAFAFVAIVVGCSTEARYRIKTVIFTGVPPLHEETVAGGIEQAETPQTAADIQMAKQKRHRDALVSRFWQHGPFAAGECGRCHSLGQSKSFTGNRDIAGQAASPMGSISASSRLIMPKQELCISCHERHGATFANTRNLQQHPQVAQGLCTGCHNPHQSLRRYMLVKTSNIELCGGCHSPDSLSSVHAAEPERDCITCHNAHVGITNKLLSSDAQELALLYSGQIGE